MKYIFIIFVALGIAGSSCKKEEEKCVTCSINTSAPGSSSSKSFCGTDSEISQEDARLKNECSDLQAQYPQYTFDCGCN